MNEYFVFYGSVYKFVGWVEMETVAGHMLLEDERGYRWGTKLRRVHYSNVHWINPRTDLVLVQQIIEANLNE